MLTKGSSEERAVDAAVIGVFGEHGAVQEIYEPQDGAALSVGVHR